MSWIQSLRTCFVCFVSFFFLRTNTVLVKYVWQSESCKNSTSLVKILRKEFCIKEKDFFFVLQSGKRPNLLAKSGKDQLIFSFCHFGLSLFYCTGSKWTAVWGVSCKPTRVVSVVDRLWKWTTRKICCAHLLLALILQVPASRAVSQKLRK